MAWQKIQKICPRCEGVKETVDSYSENEPVLSTCRMCNGKGYIPWGRLKVETEAE